MRRMTVPIVWHATSVMFGNTAHAWASPKEKLKRTTSTLSATTASVERRTRKSPRFQVSSFTLDYHLHRQLRNLR